MVAYLGIAITETHSSSFQSSVKVASFNIIKVGVHAEGKGTVGSKRACFID